ncbi:MAG: hypothetical protein ACRD0P_28365, partial [Stackebrandtia sp.]
MLLDNEIPAEVEKRLIERLREAGVDSKSRRKLAHRSGETLSWLVLLALPLQGFLSGIGAEAIKDIYASTKRQLRRITDREDEHESESRPMILQDADSGLMIVLEGDLPAEAYRRLTELDLSEYRHGPVHY